MVSKRLIGTILEEKEDLSGFTPCFSKNSTISATPSFRYTYLPTLEKYEALRGKDSLRLRYKDQLVK